MMKEMGLDSGVRAMFLRNCSISAALTMRMGTSCLAAA